MADSRGRQRLHRQAPDHRRIGPKQKSHSPSPVPLHSATASGIASWITYHYARAIAALSLDLPCPQASSRKRRPELVKPEVDFVELRAFGARLQAVEIVPETPYPRIMLDWDSDQLNSASASDQLIPTQPGKSPTIQNANLHDAQVRGEFEVCKGKALGDDLWQTFGASWQRGSARTEVAVCC